MTDLERDAQSAFGLAVDAAKPFERTRQALHARQNAINAARQVHVLAAGKAALDMVGAALLAVPAAKRGEMIAITNYENERPIDGCHVFGASHPVPDEAGAHAASVLEQAALTAGADDLVICLISGGASALMPAPIEGVSLADKIETTQLLLKSGADITAFNTVRKVLSRLKGGGLARAVFPARCISLILSDVPGDDLSIIASGPTVPDDVSVDAARRIVEQFGLLDAVPASVRVALSAQRDERRSSFAEVDNVLIGSNAISLATLGDALFAAGYDVSVMSEWLEGDVDAAAELFAGHARSALPGRRAVIAGGETSVHVTGTGAGGRNQHMALALAQKLAGFERDYVFLSGGTDGRDGPTDAAGGVVSTKTLARARAGQIDLAAFLANNDSYHGLKAVDGLLMTGATGTNVADLQLLLLG